MNITNDGEGKFRDTIMDYILKTTNSNSDFAYSFALHLWQNKEFYLCFLKNYEMLRMWGFVPKVEKLIESAKANSPKAIPFFGRFTEEEEAEIKKVCNVKVFMEYMGGVNEYRIAWRGE